MFIFQGQSAGIWVGEQEAMNLLVLPETLEKILH